MSTINAAIGDKILITTNDWFYAPDGDQYRAVHGTLRGILSDANALGIKTNRHSTDWYIEIGDMIIAGCQVYYAIRSDECSFGTQISENFHEGKLVVSRVRSKIYNADGAEQ